MYKIMFILKTGEPGTWMFCLVVRNTDVCMYMPYTICNIQYTYAYAYHMYIDIDSNIEIYRHAYVYVGVCYPASSLGSPKGISFLGAGGIKVWSSFLESPKTLINGPLKYAKQWPKSTINSHKGSHLHT